MPEVPRFIANLLNTDGLPSPPQVALKVVQVCQDPNKGFRDLSEVLALDSALSAKILGISNSASYSRGREIANISNAIAVLGTKSISVIALGFSLKTSIPSGGQVGGLSDGLLWRHSVATAVASRSLARLIRHTDSETAFLCGLMSRVGQLLMLSMAPTDYEAAVEASSGVLPSATDEIQTLGVSHHTVGCLLLEKWNLPKLICDVVEHWGDENENEQDDDLKTLTSIIQVGNTARELLLGTDKAACLLRLHELAEKKLDISTGEIDRMFVAFEQELCETLEAFDDPDWDKLDCESILEIARKQLVQVSLGIAADLTQAQDDATSLEEANRDLQKASTTDPLTGLKNRAALNLELETLHQVRTQNGPSRPYSIVMVDVDHFKAFNDTYGHVVGDQVLQTVAKALKDSARATDFIARYGGEEFTVILSNAGQAEAATVAERCRAAIENRGIELEDKTLSVTASFGVASSDSFPFETPLESILMAADAALYTAKEQGRNRVSAHGQSETASAGQ